MRPVQIFAIVLIVVALSAAMSCAKEVERPDTRTPTALPPTATSTPLPLVTPTAGPATPLPPTPASSPISVPLPTPTLATPTPARPLPTPAPTPVPIVVLQVEGPDDGDTIREDAVVVFGTTTPGATVTIAGQAAPVGRDGRFQAEVPLVPGPNLIEVVATYVDGQQVSRTIGVTALQIPRQPFVLLITQPENQSVVRDATVTVSGQTAYDAVLTINAVGVTVDELGRFSTPVRLNPGPNLIEAVATSAEGQQLSAVIAVIYRP